MLDARNCLRVVLLAAAGAWPVADSSAHVNTFHKDFVMDAPWRVRDAGTPIPLVILLKDCDTDDIRKLACEYATERPAVIRVNYGIQRSEHGGNPGDRSLGIGTGG